MWWLVVILTCAFVAGLAVMGLILVPEAERFRLLACQWMEQAAKSEEALKKSEADLAQAIASLETAKGMLAPLRQESDSRGRMLRRAKDALEAIIEEEKA